MVHILGIEISLLDLAELRLHYKTAGNLCYHAIIAESSETDTVRV